MKSLFTALHFEAARVRSMRSEDTRDDAAGSLEYAVDSALKAGDAIKPPDFVIELHDLRQEGEGLQTTSSISCDKTDEKEQLMPQEKPRDLIDMHPDVLGPGRDDINAMSQKRKAKDPSELKLGQELTFVGDGGILRGSASKVSLSLEKYPTTEDQQHVDFGLQEVISEPKMEDGNMFAVSNLCLSSWARSP